MLVGGKTGTPSWNRSAWPKLTTGGYGEREREKAELDLWPYWYHGSGKSKDRVSASQKS